MCTDSSYPSWSFALDIYDHVPDFCTHWSEAPWFSCGFLRELSHRVPLFHLSIRKVFQIAIFSLRLLSSSIENIVSSNWFCFQFELTHQKKYTCHRNVIKHLRYLLMPTLHFFIELPQSFGSKPLEKGSASEIIQCLFCNQICYFRQETCHFVPPRIPWLIAVFMKRHP